VHDRLPQRGGDHRRLGKGVRGFDAGKAFRACVTTATNKSYDGTGEYMNTDTCRMRDREIQPPSRWSMPMTTTL